MEDINILIQEIENKLNELKNKLNNNLKTKQNNKKYIPNNKEELKGLIKDEKIYLGDIDTSNITDMSYLFYGTKRENFNGIESWDTSNVIDMSWMFAYAENANPDVSQWKFNKLLYYYKTFFNCNINLNYLKKLDLDLNILLGE